MFPRVLVVYLLLSGSAFAQNFTGIIDGYYGYNFNKPRSGKNLYRAFDFNHNQFGLNYAELAIEHKSGPLGFRADIGFGDAATWVHAQEPAGVNVYQHLQQAYLSAIHKKVQVDFGKFVSPAGAEVIETKDNWNYSRSFLFAWGLPRYHFGARVVYSANEKLTVTGFSVNGWNNVTDNNQAKTVGAQAVLRPMSKVVLKQTYIAGKERAGGNDVRQLFDSVATATLNSKVSVIANYDYGMDRFRGARVRWQGFALYGRVVPKPRFSISPRFEWFDDPQGFTTGTSQTLKEGTLTADMTWAEGMLLRGEYRYDWSDRRVFERNNRTLSHQSSLTLGVVYTYSRNR